MEIKIQTVTKPSLMPIKAESSLNGEQYEQKLKLKRNLDISFQIFLRLLIGFLTFNSNFIPRVDSDKKTEEVNFILAVHQFSSSSARRTKKRF